LLRAELSTLRPPLPRLRFIVSRVAPTLAAMVVATCVFAGSAGARVTAHAARASGAQLPPSSKAHVETWAFDDLCNGGVHTGAAFVRRWLTFAESNCGPHGRKARKDCHGKRRTYCVSMQYLDTDWDYPGQSARPAFSASESWWLHEPVPNQGTRIYSSAYGGGYLMNQSNPAVQSFFRSFVRRHYNRDDGLLMDWQTPGLSQQLFYSTCGCSRTSEVRSDAALRANHGAMSAALTHRNGAPFLQADNSLPANPFLPQGLDMLHRSTGVRGWMAEGLPESGGTMDPYYSTLLDQIAYVAKKTSGFVVPMSSGDAGAAYQAQSRRVQEATMLLGYTRTHLVDWDNLEEGSTDLSVWPEEGIVPTHPLQTMHAPGGRGCLAGRGKVCSRGVYRREFSACYLRKHPFGACAAIVNTTGHTVTIRKSWLKIRLHHQITFVGGDVQSRGQLALTAAAFIPGSAQLGPHDAVLLAP
jgi:hypothetical protein